MNKAQLLLTVPIVANITVKQIGAENFDLETALGTVPFTDTEWLCRLVLPVGVGEKDTKAYIHDMVLNQFSVEEKPGPDGAYSEEADLLTINDELKHMTREFLANDWDAEALYVSEHLHVSIEIVPRYEEEFKELEESEEA